jgi:hypothetical protein
MSNRFPMHSVFFWRKGVVFPVCMDILYHYISPLFFAPFVFQFSSLPLQNYATPILLL